MRMLLVLSSKIVVKIKRLMLAKCLELVLDREVAYLMLVIGAPMSRWWGRYIGKARWLSSGSSDFQFGPAGQGHLESVP